MRTICSNRYRRLPLLQGKNMKKAPTNHPNILTRAIAVALATACAAPALQASGPPKVPYKIVCTTGMVTDIVRNVAGERAFVEGIIREGIDPHLYQSTRSDIAKLLKADVIFYSGLMLEGKMADALVKVGRKHPVFAVTELIDESTLLEPPEFAGHHDPHVWMDPVLWRKCAEMVARTLAEFDPAGATIYRKNFASYGESLDELDGYARRVLSSIPEKRRILITAHDAFNYLGRAYGIDVRGIQGISTESEAGIADVNKLVELLVSKNIAAVFVETSVSDKTVHSLIEGAAAQNHTVIIGGNLFSDAMGKPNSYEGTYIGMIDHNVTTITRALGGTAPKQGMSGKLSSTQ